MLTDAAVPPVLVRVVRDGVVESVHRGDVVVAAPDSTVLSAWGRPELSTYVRSAVKPLQALAVQRLLGQDALAGEELALACASHTGTFAHQDLVRTLLGRAGLDERALRCPPALPDDPTASLELRTPGAIAHNCSGKHAAFLLAAVAVGQDPATYLDVDGEVQQAVREALAETTGAVPSGPGVDGCGAPAWLVPLRGLAVGTARLAAGQAGLATIRDAMCDAPFIVGGDGCADTDLMRTVPGVVAKRGAEAVFAAGMAAGMAATPSGGPVGIALKVADGGIRAAGTVAAAVLDALGAEVDERLRRPPVLGGGQPHGALEVDEGLLAAVATYAERT